MSDPFSHCRILLSAIALHNFTLRLQCVLQPLCSCLSSDSGLPTASQCVSVLMSTCGHRSLAQQLCCQHGKAPPLRLTNDSQPHSTSRFCFFVFSLIAAVISPADPCVFLKLFSFTRTRTDRQTPHGDWIQLDLQVTHSQSISQKRYLEFQVDN